MTASEGVEGVQTGLRPEKRVAGMRVEIHHLWKSYAGRAVLYDLDLTLAPGEFLAVVGRSGCGKSTLLRQLVGLEFPEQGEITCDGLPLTRLNPDTRVMFQEDRLLPWKSVRDNVGLGLTGDWRPVSLASLFDVGLMERAGDWPAVLSGGQKQRVALARALAHSPRLLLLDEPMGALDALTRIEMQRLIERLWLERGFTSLLVTHDVGEAVTLADRIILLEQGQVTRELKVDLPRPRVRGSSEFSRLEAEVLDWILSIYGGFI